MVTAELFSQVVQDFENVCGGDVFAAEGHEDVGVCCAESALTVVDVSNATVGGHLW